jgi:predicted nucleic acid-binding protein
MPDKIFFDTNVVVYALAEGDPRTERAEELLDAGGVVSVQVLNEFVSVARRKMSMSWSEIADAVGAVLTLCPSPVAITLQTHEAARRIAENYAYSIYDALVIAAAIEGECQTLFSEDLRNGQTIDGRITIRNPFVRSPR